MIPIYSQNSLFLREIKGIERGDVLASVADFQQSALSRDFLSCALLVMVRAQ
jgi:hypothetical protein